MRPTTVTTNELFMGGLQWALVVQFVHQVTGMPNDPVRESVPMAFVVRYGHPMHVSLAEDGSKPHDRG